MTTTDSNKVLMVIGFTLILTLGLGILSGIIFEQPKPTKAGYELPDAAPAGEASAPAAAQDPPLADLLKTASAEKGAAVFKKCTSCHTIDKGGKAGNGPNLYGVLGGPHAHMEGFAYSDAMKSLHDKTWTAEDFYHFIKSPQAYIKGTKMSFPGLTKPQDRADVLLYLNSQSEHPVDLPKS
jgi:cytochrome c